MEGFAPRREFSQNFLTDPNTADKIVAALEAVPGDNVFEIGPGTGVLTQRLVKTGATVVAADLDRRSIEYLGAQPWAKSPLLNLMLADVLAIELDSKIFEPNSGAGVIKRPMKVIGNIPYSISSDILFWLFRNRHLLSRAVIMMQREVAQRMVAQPSTKEYGILTVACWFASDPKILFHVKPGSFFPKPAVTSSVVRFQFGKTDPHGTGMDDFMTFVRAAFSQRRKVMSNSLRTYMNGRTLPDKSECGFDLARTRAEELAPQQLFDIYSMIRATT